MKVFLSVIHSGVCVMCACWNAKTFPAIYFASNYSLLTKIPSFAVYAISAFVILSLCHLPSCKYPINRLVARGQDPVSIDCVGSSHIMGDLWPQCPLWLLASVCSCGESWHSSPVGQDTIILHCKECNTICKDWATDNNNLHEKQAADDLFQCFQWANLQWSGKTS